MIENRLEALKKLQQYLQAAPSELQAIFELTERNNGWFTQEFIHYALQSIINDYLPEDKLLAFAKTIIPVEHKKNNPIVGIIMAGNIPLVGFHDFLCVYLSGHSMHIKLSSKDETLMKHVITKLMEFDSSLTQTLSIKTMLKECNAYIATGSNQSASVFKQYFGKYPNLIRNSKTSVAVLTGNETMDELSALADDVYTYFGLGCRNVTKIYVPEQYDFIPLLTAFKKFDELKHHNKYRNNYDYQLALYILNNQVYMSNESLLLIEHDSLFSPIAVLHYTYYKHHEQTLHALQNNSEIQCIAGAGEIPFGQAQHPSLTDYADGLNTVDFLNHLV